MIIKINQIKTRSTSWAIDYDCYKLTRLFQKVDPRVWVYSDSHLRYSGRYLFIRLDRPVEQPVIDQLIEEYYTWRKAQV